MDEADVPTGRAGTTKRRGPVFTLDLEKQSADQPLSEFEVVVEGILAFLADRQVRGTVFVVGALAREVPKLVRTIADAGHEIALHGYEHVKLADRGTKQLARDCALGRDVLEQIAGVPVVGFRAPFFSLVAQTSWAPSVIGDAGFVYSSSVLPARNPIAGFPQAPRRPFRWANGLVEFPCPVIGAGPIRIPFMGGAYMRILPEGALRWLARRREGTGDWLYCHPYDFDPGEPFQRLPETTPLQNRLLWVNRSEMYRRVSVFVPRGAGVTMSDLASDPAFASTLPPWSPPAASESD